VPLVANQSASGPTDTEFRYLGSRFSRQDIESPRLVWHRTNLRGVAIALQSITTVSLGSREPSSLNNQSATRSSYVSSYLSRRDRPGLGGSLFVGCNLSNRPFISGRTDIGIVRRCVLCGRTSEMWFLGPENRRIFKKPFRLGTNRDEDLAYNGVCVECMALPLGERKILADRSAKHETA
jgi:hypothetical protein